MNLIANFVRHKIKAFLTGYFEDSDNKPIKIEIASDEIRLNKIHLNKEELNKQLNQHPIQIVSGEIELLHIKIPWSNLFNSPLEVFIDNTVVESELKNGYKWSNDNLFNHEIALNKLFETFKANVKKEIATEAKLSDSSFVSNIKNRIIDNLQIKITNFKLSCKMPFTLSEPTLNVNLDEFNFFTSDSSFENPTFFYRDGSTHTSMIHKVAELKDFSFEIFDINNDAIERINAEKQIGEYTQVFKLNLRIHATIKTTHKQDDQPKFRGLVNVKTLKMNMTERKLNHILEATKSISTFNSELAFFLNHQMQKPRLRIFEVINQNSQTKKIVVKRWWLYALLSVLKDIHWKRRDELCSWMNLKELALKKYKGMPLPGFLIQQFKEPLRLILTELIDKKWRVENGLANESKVIDLETIITFVPESQLRILVRKTCKSVIELERHKQKGVSFIKRILSRIGLYDYKPQANEMVKLLEENITKDESFEQRYTLSFGMTIQTLKFNLKTDYGSVFTIQSSNWKLKTEQMGDETILLFSVKTFNFSFSNNVAQHKVFSAKESSNEFIDSEFRIDSKVKSKIIKGRVDVQPSHFELKKEIFEEGYLFLQNRNKMSHREVSSTRSSMNLSNAFRKNFKEISPDIYLSFSMNSMSFSLILDDKNNRELLINTGLIRAKINTSDFSKNSSYALDLNNLNIDYIVRKKEHRFISLSVFGKAELSYPKPTEIVLISKFISTKLHPLLFLDLLNYLLLFKRENLNRKTSMIKRIVRETSINHYMSSIQQFKPSTLKLKLFSPVTLQLMNNKTFIINKSDDVLETNQIPLLKFSFYKKFEKYILKVQ